MNYVMNYLMSMWLEKEKGGRIQGMDASSERVLIWVLSIRSAAETFWNCKPNVPGLTYMPWGHHQLL